MTKTLPTTQFVTLSDALSWIAFGDARNRQDLNKELVGKAFGKSYKEAKQRLGCAISMLATAGFDGKVALYGKYLAAGGADADAELNEPIPAIRLGDFKQFDITVDGLRFGSGLAWLPDENGNWVFAAPKRVEAYVNVTARRSDLMRVFSSGNATIAGTEKRSLPQLGQGALTKWYVKLRQAEKELPEEQLRDLAKAAFPGNRIARTQIREFTRGRNPGRRPNPR